VGVERNKHCAGGGSSEINRVLPTKGPTDDPDLERHLIASPQPEHSIVVGQARARKGAEREFGLISLTAAYVAAGSGTPLQACAKHVRSPIAAEMRRRAERRKNQRQP
jgi:hypothetical protein